jgi:hypothetical protein
MSTLVLSQNIQLLPKLVKRLATLICTTEKNNKMSLNNYLPTYV